jgi:hypothetical protein
MRCAAAKFNLKTKLNEIKRGEVDEPNLNISAKLKEKKMKKS